MARRVRSTDVNGEDGHNRREPFFNGEFAKEVAKYIFIFLIGGGAGYGGLQYAVPELDATYTQKVDSNTLQINKNTHDIESLKNSSISATEHAVVMSHISDRDIHLNQDTMSKLATKDDMRSIQQRLERIENLLMQRTRN